MSISARYRSLTEDVGILQQKIQAAAVQPAAAVDRELTKALQALETLFEQVGEIPQFKLEKELTPVLIKAHSALDRGRLQLAEAGDQGNAERIWEVEQQIYRLLNDL